MISPAKSESAPLGQLASFLAARRPALLANWRTACETDPDLRSVNGLSRDEFTNQVPFMLDVLQQQLLHHHEEAQVDRLAAEHGLLRWHKGYVLAELLAEMHYLGQSMLAELGAFWQLYPSTNCPMITQAYEHFFAFANQINTGSVSQFTDLLRTAAASRVNVLEKALAELQALSQQRLEILRHSSHDLRGSFGTIQGAASLLELVIDSQQERKQMLDMLLRNLTTCRSLVTQLMDLARLEAGQEALHIQPLDAGQLLTNLVASYQFLATERGLLLKADGPASLPVVCDPLALQRIIQNLVLNALKHTPTGWVSVSWSRETETRWMVSVQDSGPGLPTATQAGSPPHRSVPTTETTATYDFADAQQVDTTHSSRSGFAHQGEGVGLSIVKGLCELLRASLEIDSQPGIGTVFRIRLSIQKQL
ncbi:sensor histidine kinase KdpD [Spirosoma sp. KNUC1025]|uniref:sensor histidine kinase n=1 Tax=Spirosoma sp. KNUC1025 TaxID=2894082 RepID=UPI001E5C1811|nr:HAMP domain-containing sensor histidine kinase [Spirosoma sp. KNUC1025]UFH57883.1 HAMP domain-containing histidine kinase [Spirosoma sp. KNUC1025]